MRRSGPIACITHGPRYGADMLRGRDQLLAFGVIARPHLDLNIATETTQQSRFAGTGRSEQSDKFTRLYIQTDITQSRKITEVLLDAFNTDRKSLFRHANVSGRGARRVDRRRLASART